MSRNLLAVALLLISSAVPAHAEGWTSGPQSSGDDTYVGFVDQPAPGASVTTPFEVRGWAVDQTAEGWSGIDQVQVFTGAMDQGGQPLATAIVGLDRQDVAEALGNPFYAASGFAATVPAGAIPVGSSTLNVYIHSPEKGWWQQQVAVQVTGQAQAQPKPQPPPQPPATLQFSDDPLVVVQAPLPNAFINPSEQTLTVRGIALDRNAPANSGVGGSGVSRIVAYLDGNKRDGTFLAEATLGKASRDATGWGERFDKAGWEMQIHPKDLELGPHALFIYSTSAATPNETLTVLPFRIQ
jgi:hypothetical protein